jgi:hypothetical protein
VAETSAVFVIVMSCLASGTTGVPLGEGLGLPAGDDDPAGATWLAALGRDALGLAMLGAAALGEGLASPEAGSAVVTANTATASARCKNLRITLS